MVRNGLSSRFAVSGTSREGDDLEGEAELRVCKNCLSYLNYKNANRGSRERRKIAEEFSLDQFFATYSSYFTHMPQRSAEEMASNRYSPGWSGLSREYRNKVQWKCEGCRVELSDQQSQRLLHVHHANGVKGDDRLKNLRALCADCHSKQPMHQHLFVSKSDRTLIQTFRKAQRLYKAPEANSTSAADWDEAIKYGDPAVHGLLFEL